MECPCKGCIERNAECHGRCVRYAEWDTAHKEECKEVAKKKKNTYVGQTIRSRMEIIRRMGLL